MGVQKLPQKGAVSGSSRKKPKVNLSNKFGIKVAKQNNKSAVTQSVRGKKPPKSVL